LIDERLEEISNKIRQGIPVGVIEAMEAIYYQEKLRIEKENNTIFKRFIRWIRRK
jgi:hypothetical protein